MKNPYLYILARKDLDSMTDGKMVAHGAHASNQFTHDTDKRLHVESAAMTDPLVELSNGYNAWKMSARGFGTTITLHATSREIETAVMVANSITGLVAATVVDPTYPYILDKEYAALIDHETMIAPSELAKGVAAGTINPGNAPTPIGGRKMLCLREEMTAGYVFGDKATAKMVVGNFPLMP